jgi:hypothetical protein
VICRLSACIGPLTSSLISMVLPTLVCRGISEVRSPRIFLNGFGVVVPPSTVHSSTRRRHVSCIIVANILFALTDYFSTAASTSCYGFEGQEETCAPHNSVGGRCRVLPPWT